MKKKKSIGVTIGDLRRLVELFEIVEDPRVKARSDHLLIDIIVVTVCSMICGAKTVFDIEDFGDSYEEWLKEFLILPNGIPSHDTFSRVLSLLSSDQLESIFFEWTRTITGPKTKHISVDGKSIKGTERNLKKKVRPLHSVSVYSHELGLTLMHTKSKGAGSAESESAGACLAALDLKGVTVLADAGLATRSVVESVRGQNGNYIIPIKGNNPKALKTIKDLFESNPTTKGYETFDKAHGRKERRVCRVLEAKNIEGLFEDAKTVIEIFRSRESKDTRAIIQKTQKKGHQHYEKNLNDSKTKVETTYYVSSAKLSAKEALEKVRRHWGIENKVHWVLDTAFREDEWKTRDRALAHNLSLLRRMAFNLVKRMPGEKSVRRKMKIAGWRTDYLEQIIFAEKGQF